MRDDLVNKFAARISKIDEEVMELINENVRLQKENVRLQKELKELQEEKRMDSAESVKPILCLDFDNVCHSYTSGWRGADNIPDPPVPGLFDFLNEAKKHFRIAIYSSRNHHPGGIKAMQEWFLKHEQEWREKNTISGWATLDHIIEYPLKKPQAKVTIDARCIRFVGDWPNMSELIAFEPHNRTYRNPLYAIGKRPV